MDHSNGSGQRVRPSQPESYGGNLLTPRLEAMRLATPVADSIRVPRIPDDRRVASDVEHLAYREAASDRALGFVPVGRYKGLVLTDKAFPHAVHDLMMVSAGQSQFPGLFDQGIPFAAGAGKVMARFANFASTQGLHPLVGWSFDPHTLDRQSFQMVKVFHGHLMARSKEELTAAAQIARPLEELHAFRRRRISDEVATLGSVIVGDFAGHLDFKHMQHVSPGLSSTSASTVQFQLINGWETLENPSFWKELRVVQGRLYREYEGAVKALFTAAPRDRMKGYGLGSGNPKRDGGRYTAHIKDQRGCLTRCPRGNRTLHSSTST